MEESVMKKSYIRTTMTIETTNKEELQRILDHHIDYLIDMEVNSDIQSVEGVVSYDVDSTYDAPKLKMLASIVSDILYKNPSDDDLDNDDDAIELYNNIQKLAESLENMGY